MPPDKDSQCYHASDFPYPQLGPPCEGKPVGQTDPFLLRAAFAPLVKSPAAKWPEKRIGKEPDAVKHNMADEGCRKQPIVRCTEYGQTGNGYVRKQCMGEEHSRLISPVEINPRQRLVDQVGSNRGKGYQSIVCGAGYAQFRLRETERKPGVGHMGWREHNRGPALAAAFLTNIGLAEGCGSAYAAAHGLA
jgi:hypothetical protein